MAQTKPKAAQFYGVSGDGTAGQVLISDGNGGMSWGANTENYTVSWATPTGQSLTYTQPNPQSSSGGPGSVFPTTTFTATKSGEEISGTATIAGLPTGITASQSLSGTGVDNVLTVTLTGVFPGADSLNTALTISGLTVAPPLTVSYLVVAGGGGAGYYAGAGGGGGGLRTSYTNSSSLNGHNETALTLSPATNYSLTVGGGGVSRPASVGSGANYGDDGNNSIFSTITSTGGGGGGGGTGAQNGRTGGCGGGGARYNSGTATGGTVVTSPVTQGYPGGGGNTNTNGAGGGAGAAGIDNNNTGGAGLAVNILNATNSSSASVGQVSGSNTYYAGGGGGYSNGSGGIGGGGAATGSASATGGLPNTGGGAGGDNGAQNKGGGSGLVILRYPSVYTITVGAGITQSSGSPFTEGSDKVSVFTAGTGNIQFN